MAEAPKEQLRVEMDEEFRKVLERAHQVTGIRGRSDLVRYCIQDVVQRRESTLK
jgi:metal-responsive CopG/Arc/MetJ family transcriptional regulator